MDDIKKVRRHIALHGVNLMAPEVNEVSMRLIHSMLMMAKNSKCHTLKMKWFYTKEVGRELTAEINRKLEKESYDKRGPVFIYGAQVNESYDFLDKIVLASFDIYDSVIFHVAALVPAVSEHMTLKELAEHILELDAATQNLPAVIEDDGRLLFVYRRDPVETVRRCSDSYESCSMIESDKDVQQVAKIGPQS